MADTSITTRMPTAQATEWSRRMEIMSLPNALCFERTVNFVMAVPITHSLRSNRKTSGRPADMYQAAMLE